MQTTTETGKTQTYARLVPDYSMSGDDMMEGDIAVIDPGEPFIDGKIYHVYYGNGIERLRHVFKADGKVRLVASAPKLKEVRPKDCLILGRVIRSITWRAL
jgi:SOS-response transcriptional repressor LexA